MKGSLNNCKIFLERHTASCRVEKPFPYMPGYPGFPRVAGLHDLSLSYKVIHRRGQTKSNPCSSWQILAFCVPDTRGLMQINNLMTSYSQARHRLQSAYMLISAPTWKIKSVVPVATRRRSTGTAERGREAAVHLPYVQSSVRPCTRSATKRQEGRYALYAERR